jgi:hypothetical protein
MSPTHKQGRPFYFETKREILPRYPQEEKERGFSKKKEEKEREYDDYVGCE